MPQVRTGQGAGERVRYFERNHRRLAAASRRSLERCPVLALGEARGQLDHGAAGFGFLIRVKARMS